MSHSRQMHFGVFWVGTGNHFAGWRHEGAATSNSHWPAVVESAQIAERGVPLSRRYCDVDQVHLH
jgi:N-acetyl-S-(2-succino)cysteine monooxygenase